MLVQRIPVDLDILDQMLCFEDFNYGARAIGKFLESGLSKKSLDDDIHELVCQNAFIEEQRLKNLNVSFVVLPATRNDTAIKLTKNEKKIRKQNVKLTKAFEFSSEIYAQA